MKYWEIIAQRLKSQGWSYGYCTAINRHAEQIFIVDAHRNDGDRYVVQSDEILSAFLELERVSLKRRPLRRT